MPRGSSLALTFAPRRTSRLLVCGCFFLVQFKGENETPVVLVGWKSVDRYVCIYIYTDVYSYIIYIWTFIGTYICYQL